MCKRVKGHVTASLCLQNPGAVFPLFSKCRGQDRLGQPTSEGCISRSFVHQGCSPLGTQLYVVVSDWPSHTEQTLSLSPASLPATWKLQGNRFQTPRQPSLLSGFWLLLHFWSLMTTYLFVISSMPLKYHGWHFKINFSGKIVQYRSVSNCHVVRHGNLRDFSIIYSHHPLEMKTGPDNQASLKLSYLSDMSEICPCSRFNFWTWRLQSAPEPSP